MDISVMFLVGLVFVPAFLGALVVFSEVRNYIERKHLLNRIMARDYAQYILHDIESRKGPGHDKVKDHDRIKL